MEFHLIKLGTRPLLAVPCGLPKMWQVAIDCYPAHTWKKRLVRVILGGVARVGLLGKLFPARELSLPGVGKLDFESWLGSLGEELNVSELHPVLVWPADPARGRVYIYLLNNRGEKLGFCKLGLDAKNNELIERERRALELLGSMKLKLSRIPKLLAHGCLVGEIEGGAYLVVEITPTNARNIDWQCDASIEANIAEYAGSNRTIERAEVESLGWWTEVKRVFAGNVVFIKELEEACQQGIEVCLAHGDLNCTNVLRGVDEIWLLDWEQSDQNAPVLTDQVCVAVDKLWLANPDDAAGNLQKFSDIFKYDNDPKKRAQVIMALAYLGASGFPPALAMIDARYPNA